MAHRDDACPSVRPYPGVASHDGVPLQSTRKAHAGARLQLRGCRRKEVRMSRGMSLALLLFGTMTVSGSASAALDGMSITIDKRAQSMSGAVIFTARVTCGPLRGRLDFRQSVIS